MSSVKWNNVEYNSVMEAAVANHVSYSIMYNRLARGKTGDSDMDKARTVRKKRIQPSKMRLDYAIQRKVMGK